jgi:PAS domain S-box-containing protein
MATRKPTSETSSGSVVYADNDRIFLEAIGDFLKTKGFTVHLAQDGLEALEMARRTKPDYLILDIVMPKLSGARVCWLVRQDEDLHHTPIIAFSSLSREDYRWFREMSADAYVAKGPLATACQNLLLAIEQLGPKGRHELQTGILGYGDLRSRQLVREMLDERAHLMNLLQAIGEAILELDEHGRIMLATPWACQLLGKKEASLIGEKFSSLCDGKDRSVLQELVEEVIKAGSTQRFPLAVRIAGREMSLELVKVNEIQDWVGVLVLLHVGPARTTPPGDRRTGLPT